MWRSFFLAVGIFTILVGLETMVVDHVIMTNVRRIPKMVTGKAKGMVNAPAPVVAQNQPVTARSQPRFQMPTFNRPLNSGPSARRPTTYRGTQSATFNRVLDSSGSSQTNRSPGNGFPRLQNRGNNLAAQPVATTPTAPQPSRLKRSRIVETKDWMPWSLLATGTIIILYTHSLGRSHEQ